MRGPLLLGCTVLLTAVYAGFARAPATAERPDIVWMAGGHAGPVSSVAFSPDGSMLASASRDDTIKLWRVSDGSLIRTLTGDCLLSVAFSPDGRLLASGGGDNTIKLWRMTDGSLITTLKEHTEAVTSVAFSPDGSMIASGSWDGAVKLWRVGDGKLIRNLRDGERTDLVTSVAFSPDGGTIASGYFLGAIKLWRVSDGKLMRTIEGHSWVAYFVAFSPDGKVIASANDDVVKLWRVNDGELITDLWEHTEAVTSVAFSPDGSTIASGSYDKTIKLWRVSDGALLKSYDEETGTGVTSIAFSPDGRFFAYGREDGTVVVARNPFSRPAVRVHGPQLAPLAPPAAGTLPTYTRVYLTGQVHAHWMDDIGTKTAHTTPEALTVAYMDLGYDFVAPTEHHPSQNWHGFAPRMFEARVDQGRVIVIGDSLEDSAENSHVLAIGIGYGSDVMKSLEALAWPPVASKREQLERYQSARSAGDAVCVVAHPNARSRLLGTDYRWDVLELVTNHTLCGYDAIEVYNGGAAKLSASKAFDKWDEVLRAMVSMFGTCGDDYTPTQRNLCEMNRGCVTAVIDLPVGKSPTRDDVLSALRSGSFYGSYGKDASLAPRITAWWYDQADHKAKLTVGSTAGVKYRFISHAGITPWQSFPRDGVAAYEYTEKRWIRAEVRDSQGRVSFTQPLWVTPLVRSARQFPPLTGGVLRQEGQPIPFQFEDALLLFPTRPSGFAEVSGEIVGIADLPKAAPPMGYMSDCYRFTPDDAELPKGTTLTIKYEPGRVGWCPEAQIAIYWYDPKLGEWTRLQSEVDAEAKTVRAETAKLGLFAVSGEIVGEDVTPPTLKLLFPVSGGRIWEPVDVSAQAYDDNGVAVVRVILDDEVVGYDLDGADGWSVNLDPKEYPAGKHTLVVEAEDASGNTSEVSTELIFGPPVKGDLNGDDKLSLADVVIALRCAVGYEETTPQRLQAGDLDGDGKIEVAEVAQILRAMLGIITL